MANNLSLLEVSELAIDFLCLFKSPDSLLLDIDPLLLILPDHLIEALPHLLFLLEEKLLSLSEVIIGLFEVNGLLLKSVDFTLLLFDVVLEV